MDPTTWSTILGSPIFGNSDFVNGTAFFMMSIALMFANILMALMVLLYGLVPGLPVSGLM